jgi:thymidylate kinase
MDTSKPPSPGVVRTRAFGRSVALIGADGAGKSTIAHRVVAQLPFDAAYLYMGVNLEASTVMLPTTRLALILKQRRGRRPDMTVPTAPVGKVTGPFTTLRRLVRMVNWLAEETYRAALARRMQRRGATVVFDRHFFCDYYAAAVAPTDQPRSIDVRLHGWVLRNRYPRPELTLFLDAPPEVLAARKEGTTVEAARARRAEYLALAGVLPAFQVVDADRALDDVVDDVVGRILAFVEEGVSEAAGAASSEVDGSEPSLVALPDTTGNAS